MSIVTIFFLFVYYILFQQYNFYLFANYNIMAGDLSNLG